MGGSDARLGWIGILSKTITLIEFVFIFFSFCLLVLKSFKSKFLDVHRLDLIRCNFFGFQ